MRILVLIKSNYIESSYRLRECNMGAEMRYKGLDLNLLAALEVLLTEQSVSRAAAKMHLSQSAMSNALSRLRERFSDELLVPAGRGFHLSPRAHRLLPEVRAILARIDGGVLSRCSASPAMAKRHIRLMASDYVSLTALAEGLSKLSVEAPNLTFDIIKMTDQPFRYIEQYDIDLLITSDLYISHKHPSQPWFCDDYVALVCSHGKWTSQNFDRDSFSVAPQIAVRFEPRGNQTHDENMLSTLGIMKDTVLTISSHALIPYFLVGTDRVATLQRRLAAIFMQQFPLRLIELPVVVPPIKEVFQWHQSNDGDPVLDYVRHKLLSLMDGY